MLNAIDRLAQRYPLVAGAIIGAIPYAVLAVFTGV
jgi:hypothetical protein